MDCTPRRPAAKAPRSKTIPLIRAGHIATFALERLRRMRIDERLRENLRALQCQLCEVVDYPERDTAMRRVVLAIWEGACEHFFELLPTDEERKGQGKAKEGKKEGTGKDSCASERATLRPRKPTTGHPWRQPLTRAAGHGEPDNRR